MINLPIAKRTVTNQYSVWNTVFGAQGLNGYPLEVRYDTQGLRHIVLEQAH
jgi:hypothetical protein